MGINLALDVLDVARRLFDHEFPINAKFHMVVFSIFDTSTILCSAIIHDTQHRLPRRNEVVDAIASSLDRLHQLSLSTKLGASSYAFLYKLVQSHPELSRGNESSKRLRKMSSASGLSRQAQIAASSQPPVAIATEPTLQDVLFDVDQFLAQNPLGGGDALDMGGMEQIWDWEDLNLDQFPC